LTVSGSAKNARTPHDALVERIVDAVPADQEETGVLHGAVEPGGERGALLDAAARHPPMSKSGMSGVLMNHLPAEQGSV